MATLKLPRNPNLPTALKLDYRPKPPGPVKLLRLKQAALTDAQTDSLAGHLLGEDAYDVLFEGDVDVYKPNGTLLLRLRQNVLDYQDCVNAFPVWKDAAHPTGNRGNAAGTINSQEEIEAMA
jgi:hypothetical protein